MKVKVIEVQGRPQTLTQTDGNTFRIFSRQSKEIEEELISAEFYAEQKLGNILLEPVKVEEKRNPNRGGTK